MRPWPQNLLNDLENVNIAYSQPLRAENNPKSVGNPIWRRIRKIFVESERPGVAYQANPIGRGPLHGWLNESSKNIPTSFRAYECYIPLKILTINTQNIQRIPFSYNPLENYLWNRGDKNPVVKLTVIGMAAPSIYGALSLRETAEQERLRCIVNLVKGFEPISLLDHSSTIPYFHCPLEDFSVGSSTTINAKIQNVFLKSGEQQTSLFNLTPQLLRDVIIQTIFSRSETRGIKIKQRIPIPPEIFNSQRFDFISQETQGIRFDQIFSSFDKNISRKSYLEMQGLLNEKYSCVVFHCAWGWGRTGTVLGAFLLIDILYRMYNKNRGAVEQYIDYVNRRDHRGFTSVSTGNTFTSTSALVGYVIKKQRHDIRVATNDIAIVVETPGQIRALEWFERYFFNNIHLFVPNHSKTMRR